MSEWQQLAGCASEAKNPFYGLGKLRHRMAGAMLNCPLVMVVNGLMRLATECTKANNQSSHNRTRLDRLCRGGQEIGSLSRDLVEAQGISMQVSFSSVLRYILSSS